MKILKFHSLVLSLSLLNFNIYIHICLLSKSVINSSKFNDIEKAGVCLGWGKNVPGNDLISFGDL